MKNSTSMPLTVVMYHYVRDFKYCRYPEIDGLSKEDFREQIEYIKRHYNVISGQQLIEAIEGKNDLPDNPLLLTFDDGYIDHFTEVFPVLDKEKLPGCFFPPVRCILEQELLAVNKIQFILASTQDKQILVDYILDKIEENRSRYKLLAAAEYWQRVAGTSRWDSEEVVFIKRVLQRELPHVLSEEITDELFKKYVTSDEATLSRETYMTPDQIRTLQKHGMYIGAHGYSHSWLDRLSPSEQEKEIDQSLLFLDSIGVSTDHWIMCYPYGAYNESLISILKSRKCTAGLTVEVGLASLDSADVMKLPRINTNDLPKSRRAAANKWTRLALKEDMTVLPQSI